jgi:hypothetical protein
MRARMAMDMEGGSRVGIRQGMEAEVFEAIGASM